MTDQGPWGSRVGGEPDNVVRFEPRRDDRGAPTPPRQPKKAGNARVTLVVSTLLMIGFLWFLTGSWIIAGSLMFALFVHEYGHVLAMNRLGMGPATIHVIPFLGGLAKGKREPASEWIGVLVSLAGPAFGLLAMLPLVGVWLVTGNVEWIAAAFFVAMLNLINLVPAPPLDGSKALGPVLARVHPMLERGVLLVIGVVVVAWSVMTGRWFLAVFLGLAVLGHWRGGPLRGFGQPLSWGEAGKSLGLTLLTAVACGGAAVAALFGITGGDVAGAVDLVERYIGVSF